MPDFRGIGAFGEGALQGYDKALSNYAAIDQIARERAAAERARQAQALQTLIHGNTLAQTSPDVAEIAAQNPDQYGLTPETIGPGVAQARKDMIDKARLNQALTQGNLEALNDPSISRFIGKEHLKTINELQMRKKVDAIIADPNLTPQQKAQAMLRVGANPPAGLLSAGYPELGGAEAEAKAGGEARGRLPFEASLAEAKATGNATGELKLAGPLSQAKRQGELNADLSPDVTPPGVPIGGTNTGRIAKERETEADRTRKLRGPANNVVGPKDISVALNRINTAARNDIHNQLSHVPKDVWTNFNQSEQQQILDYLSNQRALKLAADDPVASGQIREMPRPAAMDKFEAQDQGGNWFTRLFMGDSTPQPPVTQPRTIRTPNEPAPGGWGKATVVR